MKTKVDSEFGKILLLSLLLSLVLFSADLRPEDFTDSEIYLIPGGMPVGVKFFSEDSSTISGIGMITFITPSNYFFGGLGHGVCNIYTDSLSSLTRKTSMVANAVISDTVQGRVEFPGKLKGTLKENIGTILANTDSGIFGILTNPIALENTIALPVGIRFSIKTGKAIIYSTVDARGVREFEIEIIRIYRNTRDSKDFLIKITDPELIKITGGIVQGMSGSPIIQNGKIIGAVTHVLVCDPTKGYGIFIENMLDSMSEMLK